VLWRKGYSYIARTALELCSQPRSLLAETQERAKRGEFSLLDSGGRIYPVRAFAHVPPFGGMLRIAHLFLRSAYAAPVLEAPVTPPLPEFKEKLACAIRLRFRDELSTV
jgi:hypothetical protein